MIKKLVLLFQTARHLKAKQVIYQVKYRLIKPQVLGYYGNSGLVSTLKPLSFIQTPPIADCWNGQGKFTFLNLPVDFGDEVNWNFQQQGKLWNYNLQYANYLLQENRTDSEKENLMTDLYSWLADGRLSLEPYPVSLRSINMMRWLSSKKTTSPHLIKSVHAELTFLSRRLEYHLLGNHLLENAFALLMGGAFYAEKNWIETSKSLLIRELQEQVLSDGAHFELSPMYQKIIFFRLLELIDWYTRWGGKESSFEKYLRGKAIKMRAWLENISFRNGDIPHFNDSADGIAFPTRWLISYADELAILHNKLPLGESGYRSVNLGDYECKVDVAQIGPAYQPGHAHADALSFILYYKGIPMFVEQGTSTYQIGTIRDRERATSAHNTVVVNNQSQSNVWGGFRVAERAKTTVIVDEANRIQAEHDGYRKLGITHKRTLEFSTDIIKIIDEVLGNDRCINEFHLHLYPELEVSINRNVIQLSNGVAIAFEFNKEIQIQQYSMANGYNRYKTGKKIVMPFENTLITTILMKGDNR